MGKVNRFFRRLWATPSDKERKSAFTKTGVRIYDSVRTASRTVWAGVGLVIMVVLGLIAWHLWGMGDGKVEVRRGDRATEVQVDAPLFPETEIPLAHVDSTGNPVIERVKVLEPEKVEAAITIGEFGEQSILIRKRKPWFPEFRRPGASMEVEVLGPDTIPVTVTAPPRPFFEVDPRPMIGAGVMPNDSTGSATVYIGADLLRAGPLHGQIGLVGAGNDKGIAGYPVDVAPGVGIEVREDLMLNGAYKWQGEDLYLGVTYKF